MTRAFFILFFFTSALMSDVKSPTGQIKFDTQMDNQAEMTLNSIGLGMGTTPSSNLHVNGNAIVSDQLFIGGSSGSSNLNMNGTLGYGFQTVSSNTTLGNSSIVLADSSSDNITITLPYAGNVIGRQYNIKKISTSNSVWISGGGNLIDDTNPIELPESSDLASVKLISDGSQWYKINQKDLSETVASDNLIGWWKLDEETGVTASDSSDYGNDGYLSGSQTFSGCMITGIVKSGLSFNGSSDNVAISNTGFFDLDVYTYSLWIRPEWISGVPSYEPAILAIRDAGGTRLSVHLDNTYADIKVWNQSSLSTYNYSFSQNTFYHIVLVHDSTNLILYVDGVFVESNVYAHNALANRQLNIGSAAGISEWFQGAIDDVRIYNKVLTSSEIQAIYNQGQ